MTDMKATPTPAEADAAPPTTTTSAGLPTGTPGPKAVRRRSEALYFAVRNKKVVFGVCVLLFMALLAIIGPMLTPWSALERGAGPRNSPPTAENWLGTTSFGQDVFTQLADGTRTSLLVGVLAAAVAATIGMVIGFLAGYRGAVADELLMSFTNIVLVLPAFVVLIVLNAYLGTRNLWIQALAIGLFSWPWVARAVRAQTLTLRARDFVDLARLSGVGTWGIIRKEIAPNMGSYLVMVFVLLFAGSILFAVLLDFIGLGPRDSMSLGLMLNNANTDAAMIYGFWWWFIPPGLAVTMITGSAYLTNVGLDEVFNPKLREM